MKMAFVLPVDMWWCLYWLIKLNWKTNKCFGNVSLALETACLGPLRFENICHCCLSTYHCGRACNGPFPQVLNCQDVNMQKPLWIYNNGTLTGECVIFRTVASLAHKWGEWQAPDYGSEVIKTLIIYNSASKVHVSCWEDLV